MAKELTGIFVFIFASPLLWVSSGILGRTKHQARDFIWLIAVMGLSILIVKLLKQFDRHS